MPNDAADPSRRDKLLLFAIALIIMFGAHACLTNCNEEAEEAGQFLESFRNFLHND